MKQFGNSTFDSSPGANSQGKWTHMSLCKNENGCVIRIGIPLARWHLQNTQNPVWHSSHENYKIASSQIDNAISLKLYWKMVQHSSEMIASIHHKKTIPRNKEEEGQVLQKEPHPSSGDRLISLTPYPSHSTCSIFTEKKTQTCGVNSVDSLQEPQNKAAIQLLQTLLTPLCSNNTSGGAMYYTCTDPRECTGGVLIWTLPYYVYIQ